jgi:hypothetical protein
MGHSVKVCIYKRAHIIQHESAKRGQSYKTKTKE